jgi:hypothetical protein
VKPLDLPGGGRGPRRGQQVLDPVLPADPVEENREWSSIPVSAFAVDRSANANPPTTSICHSSIGRAAPTAGTTHPDAAADPDRSPRPAPDTGRPADSDGNGSTRLSSAPGRSAADPSTAAAAAAPAPPPPPAPASDADSQPAGATGPPTPPDPRPHTGPATRATSAGSPPLRRHFRHGPALREHLENRPIPLLSHAQLPHAKECQESAEVAVNHQPKTCNPSTEDRTSRINRSHTRHQSRRADSNREPPDYKIQNWGVGKGRRMLILAQSRRSDS